MWVLARCRITCRYWGVFLVLRPDQRSMSAGLPAHQYDEQPVGVGTPQPSGQGEQPGEQHYAAEQPRAEARDEAPPEATNARARGDEAPEDDYAREPAEPELQPPLGTLSIEHYTASDDADVSLRRESYTAPLLTGYSSTRHCTTGLNRTGRLACCSRVQSRTVAQSDTGGARSWVRTPPGCEADLSSDEEESRVLQARHSGLQSMPYSRARFVSAISHTERLRASNECSWGLLLQHARAVTRTRGCYKLSCSGMARAA